LKAKSSLLPAGFGKLRKASKASDQTGDHCEKKWP